MTRIKKIYWLFTLLFAVITIVCVILSGENWASIMLAGVALIVSSVAMGLSDPKKLLFIGEVKVWSQPISSDINQKRRQLYKVVMHIINNSDEVVDDFVYRLRMPKSITFQGSKNRHRIDIIHGETFVLIDKSFGFLGTERNEGYIPVDFEMYIGEWKKQNIEITISGGQIKPTTFQIKQSDRQKLIDASRDKPLLATKLN